MEKENTKNEEKTFVKTEETKTGKTIGTIVLVLFLIAVAFIIGLEVGAYLTVKENQDALANETSQKNEQQETTINEIDILEETIGQLNSLLKLGKIEDTSKISDKDLFDFATLNMPSTDDGIYKLDDINTFLTNTLGQTIKNPENYDVTFVVCDYKADKKEFECFGHGGEFYQSFNRITSIKNKGDIYTVEVKKAINKRGDVGYDTKPYYKNIEDMNANKNPIFEAELYDTGCGHEYKNQPEELFYMTPNDKLGTYTYTFKKVNNNYVLVSVTY